MKLFSDMHIHTHTHTTHILTLSLSRKVSLGTGERAYG